MKHELGAASVQRLDRPAAITGPVMALILAAILGLGFAAPASAGGREDYERAVAWRAWLVADSRPVLGLALGGGGARGMAHIGVLRAFENAGIPVERIAGTSIGSFIGALYATGAQIDRIEELALKTNWSNLIELKMSRVGFFSTRRLERFINFHLNFLQRNILRLPARTSSDEYLATGLGDIQFHELKTPFICTATDLYSGAIVLFDSGPVAEAIRASCSIPGLFEPVIAENRVLVDGGVRLNLPVSLCQSIGAEAVIAIDLESDTAPSVTGLVDILAQIIRIQGRALTEAERMAADVLVAPAVGRIKMTDLVMTAEAIREGEVAGRLAADRIKDRLMGHEISPEAGRPVTPPASETRDSIAAVQEALRTGPGAARGFRQPARLAAAAVTASLLGLDREALTIGGSVPREMRTAKLVAALAASAIRLGRIPEAERLATELEDMGPGSDDWWSLAAAAVDRRHDGLASTMVRRAESVSAPRASAAPPGLPSAP